MQKRHAITSFIAGATLMYFADPIRGKRRRAIARDRFAAGVRDVANQLDKAGRDSWNRTQGLAAGVRSQWRSANPDGPVLVDRVRSRIGRAVSHPHAIHATASGNGRIVLEGPVLAHEVEYLLKLVRSTPGVREVESRLDVHQETGGVSSLQGGVPRRRMSEFAQENWTPALRVISAAAGGAALLGGITGRGPLRWAGMAGGAALVTRAVANQPFRCLLGVGPGARAVHFEKTIHINAPVEEVFTFWSNFENFPKFMTHLKQVKHLDNGRSHWVAAGPAGISIPWDAEIVEQRTNELLAWSSVPGSIVRTEGSVRFDREPDGRTRIGIRMSYCPPAGVFGHAVAWFFGADPKSEMDADLVRLKSLLEIGKTRAHGMPVTREEVAVPVAGQQPQPLT